MLEDNQKINAIAWEAKKRNFSYGVFSTMLTEENKKQIYKQYEEYLTARKEAEKARIKKYSKGKKKRNISQQNTWYMGIVTSWLLQQLPLNMQGKRFLPEQVSLPCVDWPF